MTATIERVNLTLPAELRKYAADAAGVSAKVTKIPDEHWRVLKSASCGFEVDLLDLNIALFAAMRTAATRGAQSPSRRELATKIWNVAVHVNEALDICSPEPRERPRQPRDYDHTELDDWLEQ